MRAPVSVIIPTYNRCATVVEAIDSVLQQSAQPEQIIVIDDGSTDDTPSLIRKRYATQVNPTITLIEQTNHGVSHARNRGIENATAAWVAFLDSDDRWFPKKLEKQFQALDASPEYLLCHCDEHWIRNGKRVNPMNKHQKHGGWIFEHCLPLCAISPSAAMLHQSLLKKVGLFDESLPACEDYDLWLRVSANHPVLYVDEALLAKTGGHDDQLSRAHWGMDRFRLQALAKLLRGTQLSSEQREQALAVFEEKYRILLNGSLKRGNEAFAQELRTSYASLLGE